jgi:hypothetical protein
MIYHECDRGTPPIVEFVPYEASETDIAMDPHLANAEKAWRSKDGIYQATLTHIDNFVHVKVRRLDWDRIDDFYVMFQAKNQILGIESIAVEVYPRASDLVDGSNTYHLWSWDGIEKVIPNMKRMPRYH